jgi:hypothetical protein
MKVPRGDIREAHPAIAVETSDEVRFPETQGAIAVVEHLNREFACRDCCSDLHRRLEVERETQVPQDRPARNGSETCESM